MLKSQVMKSRGPDMPMVVAGNKTDVDGALEREQTEALVMRKGQTNKCNKQEKEPSSISRQTNKQGTEPLSPGN